ncbi:MAG TPA: thioredoxin family protein [Terriglobales bacterium]|nr:thioredoxin family protein [Terriglobales bacterium]
MAYRLVDAEESPELVGEYSVMQAPTLVVVEGGKVSRFANASNIQKFAQSRI